MSTQGLDQGIVQNPFAATQLVGTPTSGIFLGKNGEELLAQTHGKWATAARFGQLWSAAATGLTVPVVGAAVASVFSLYNPPGSTAILELVDFDVGIILATTAVDFVGMYTQAGIGSNVPTPTAITVGTPINGLIGYNVNGAQGKFCTAATAATATTPVLDTILATFGAVTTTNDQPIHYEFDGKKLLPPATIAYFLMSTTVSTTAGLAFGIKWIEWPTG